MVVFNDTDWLLQRLVAYVNGSDSRVPITVSTEGLLVSGTLISRQTYLKEIYDKMVPKGAEKIESGQSAYIIKLEVDAYQKEISSDTENADRDPNYIHLLDAKFHKGDIDKAVRQKGVAWRGNLEKVSGFYLDH